MELDFPINEPIFPIRTAAKLLNISVHTLRMYEKEGLIIPYKKNSHQRLYSKSDLERIECIRHAIYEDKISIAGIKTIYSLIPCSQVLGCKENRETCTVFKEYHKPCWMLKHINNFCTHKDCRECVVYSSFKDCSSIKEIIQEITITNHKANYTL
jgi:MerR family transcriptional regulator/heat shock protein HspR